ncbi:MAG TPA: c-type cytochrome [Thermoanaerobaculia bacterium]|nr:c-type cytochrome [Thermoanaerobaculia bacterium]
MKAAALLLVLALAACDREERAFRALPPGADASPAQQLSPLVPGPARPDPRVRNPYGANAYGIAEGKRLYVWYNCVGCHAHGGGGMGPPLLDEKWIYGSHPEEIFASIAEGRPNGMPAFGHRVPPDQIWKITAYVQSMSGRVRGDAAPGRADSMHSLKPELLREARPVEGDPGVMPR